MNRQTIKRKILHLVLSGVLIFSLGAVVLSPQPVSAFPPNEYALSFDGIDDYVDCGSDSSLDIVRSFTLEAWVKLDVVMASQPDSYPTLICKQIAGYSSRNFMLALDRGGDTIDLQGFSSAGGWTVVVTVASASTYLDDLDWHHLVATWNRETTTGQIYIDGVVRGGPSPGNDIDLYTAGDNVLNLGKMTAYADSVLDGLLDEVRIYNRAITADEVTYNYNSGDGRAIPQNTGGLVGWWHMNENSGTTINDETVNDNDGTIYGAAWVAGFPFPTEAPISKIVFTTPPRTVVINQPTETMTIQTQDASDNPTPVVADTTINLTSTSGGEFSLSDTSWDPVTSLVIPTGASSATFYYKQGAMGNPTITAAETPDAGWTDATQGVTVQGPVQLWRGVDLIGTYFSIQEAVNDAMDGDDIIVLPGIYEEQIRIDKQVTVKSEDGAATTIIDAQFGTDDVCDFGGGVAAYPAVWIQRDGVVLGDLDQGFTIRNTPPMVFPEGEEEPSEWGVAILAEAPGCTIRGNTIEDTNPMGIWADVEMTIISQNIVSASIMGIYSGGGGGSILYNAVDSGYWGILVESGQGNNNISDNTVSNTWGCAIMVQQGDNHQVTNNELYDNQGMAIRLQNTSNAEVTGNLIVTDTTSIAGIYGIDVQGGNNNNISGNLIEYVLVGGITLNNTSDNNLSGNEIWGIYGYDLWGEISGDANWTREQARFDGYSVKMETGGDPSGVARLEIPSISPFQYAEIGGGLRFWAYYLPGGVTPLPTYQLELDVVLNGVVTLEGYTDCEGGPRPDEWLSCSTTGMWKNVDTTETKPLSEWINDFPGAKIVKRSVVYAGDANWTVYIDGSEQEGLPMEPPKGIAIARSNRNSVSDSIIVGVSGAAVLIVESNQNTIGDNNEIVENGTGIVIENSNENTVRGSLIAANYKKGILIMRSYNNQIIGNDIVDNFGGMSGVHLDGESNGNQIHANNIVDNTPRDGEGNIIRDGEDNIISYGVFKEGGGDWVNASGNWWGHPSGPYHEWENPGGMGDAVSNEGVNYRPWADTPLPEFIDPTLVGNLARPQMTALLGMFIGDAGPDWSSLIVEAYDNEGGVGIAKVSVNLRELLMQMLPYPIVIRLRTDNPPFDDIMVREAMSLALDYEAIRSALGGYGNIVLNPEEGLPVGYDPAAAIQLLIDAGYGQGFQTEIYIHPHYADLASILHDYWANIGVECEIRVVEMGDLLNRIYNTEYEHVVIIPYGWGIIPGNKLGQWQDWLNELERRHLSPQGNKVYVGGFNLQEDFMKQLAWYLGEENDTQKIMDKLTLGDFSIPVRVTDWCGNEVGSNIDVTIVDIIQPLQKGWNLVSTPVTLDDNYATWENLVALGNGLWCDDAIRYDSGLGEWVDVDSAYKLKPLEPIYIHAIWNDQIGAIFSRGVTLPPMLDLYGGWNLVGLAIPPIDWDSMPVNEALVTAEDASGYRGYSSVVSPGRQFDYSYDYRYRDTEGREYGFDGYNWRFEQSPWVYTIGSDDIGEMSVGGGYWVFMEAADTLAGFSTTPVTRVFLDEPGHDLDPLVPRYDQERVTRTLCEEYRDGGYTKIYLTYSGDVSPSRVVEFYRQRMAEYGWTLTAWEGSEDGASLDFALEMGGTHANCQIDVVGGESIDILYELWEPGVDLPDVLRFEWWPVAMTAYSQTTDDFSTQTNISYEGELRPEDIYNFYGNLEERLKEKGYQEYNWEKIGDECKDGEFAWFMFRRNDEQGRTYICLIWAEKGIIEIEHHQYAASVPGEYIDGVISLWWQEIEMRKWAIWGPPEEPEEPQPPG